MKALWRIVLSGLLLAGTAQAQPLRQPYAVPPPDAPLVLPW